MSRRPTRLRLTSLEDRLTPAGGLDPTFGTGGIVTTAPGRYGGRSTVVAQPDGHILVVESSGPHGTQLTRYNANGSLDTTFGTGGKVTDLVPGTTATLSNAAVGPDGKITLSGTTSRPNSSPDPTMAALAYMINSTAILRLNADGTPDAGFGTNGVASIDATLKQNDTPGFPLPIAQTGFDLALFADGSVVVASSDNHLRGLTAVRLTPAGVVDPGFGVNGLFAAGLVDGHWYSYSFALGQAVAAAPDGGVFLMGTFATPQGGWRMESWSVLLKLTPAGVLDTAFDGDGAMPLSAGDSGGVLDLAVQPDGKPLVALTRVNDSSSSAPTTSVEVARFLADGTPDAGFGTGGRAVALPDGGSAGYGSLALFPDGRVVVASGRYLAGDAGVAVLNPDGSRDGFVDGSEGIAYGPYGGTSTTVDGVAVSGDKVIVLSNFYVSFADYYQTSESQLALAVLTEGPGALPLTPEPPVVVIPPQPPVLRGEGEFVIPPMPGETLIDIVLPTLPSELIDVPVSDGRVLVPAFAPVPPVMSPPYLPQGVKVPGDVNGDGFADTVVTDGPRVAVVSGGYDGRVLVPSFAPFEASYTGTLNAVLVDVDGNGQAELVVSPGQGGGPVVAVYHADGTERGRFWGIDDANFRGGVNLAAGDLNLDGRADLIVTAGPGGGPRVAVFDGKSLGADARRLVADFFAFEATQTGGATAGVANGVLIFGAGPDGGPRVRGVDARSLFAAGGVKSLDDLPAAARRFDRFVGDPAARKGVALDFAGVDDSVTDHGGKVTADAGDGTPVTVYEYPGFGPAV